MIKRDLLFLFAEDSLIYDKAKLYEKCLAIYEFLEEDERIYSFERRAKIVSIRKKYNDFIGGKN